MKRRAIVWFRLDLRLHDNEALQDVVEPEEHREKQQAIGIFAIEVNSCVFKQS